MGDRVGGGHTYIYLCPGSACPAPSLAPATVSRTPAHPDPLPCVLAALRASQRHDLSGEGERVLPAFPVSLWRVLWPLLRDLRVLWL